MPFTTALGALLGGATQEAANVHRERYEQEVQDRKFAFDTLTHIMDDPAIGNPQVKEEALQELHGRMLETMFPDNYSHKPGKLGKLVDQFIGMQKPQGPMGPMQTAQGAGGGGQQTGVGTGNARSQIGGMVPPPPQGGANVAGSNGISVAPNLQSPQNMFGPQDITASGFMSPTAQATVAANKQAELDRIKFQQDYQTKLGTWNWLEQNDPVVKNMSTEEKRLEHARFMYNMITPVSYLRNELASGANLSFDEASRMSQQYGIPMPQNADKNGRYTYFHDMMGTPTSFQYATPLAPIQTRGVADPQSSTGYSDVFSTRDNPGKPTSSLPVAPPYSQQPRITYRSQAVTSADGTIRSVPMPSFSAPLSSEILSRWIQNPSLIGQDMGLKQDYNNYPIIGQKELPAEIPRLEQNRNQSILTLERIDEFKKDLPALNNLIDAGKIQLALDPNSPAGIVANRLVTLNEQEERIVADTMSMAEDINVLRGPLGATGFRGAEAFTALQAQKGNLMANPAITAMLLNNTKKALLASIGSSVEPLNRAKRFMADHQKQIIMGAYKDMYGADGAQRMRADGF